MKKLDPRDFVELGIDPETVHSTIIPDALKIPAKASVLPSWSKAATEESNKE